MLQVETSAEYSLRKGLINEEERQAISGINGHSGHSLYPHFLMNLIFSFRELREAVLLAIGSRS